MKIYIIGSGSIGQALALILAANSKDVVLVKGRYCTSPLSTVSLKGRINGKELDKDLEACNLEDLAGENGILLVTTKAYANQGIADRLMNRSISGKIVLLQNGLGIENPFLNRGFSDLYRCVLFASSQVDSDGSISYRSVAPSPIGIVNGERFALSDLIEEINTEDFPFEMHDNLEAIVWEKAITNCVFNSICPLLNVDNGVFIRDKEAYAIAREVIGECVGIAREYGINLESSRVEERLLYISSASDGQLISTLQDINQGNRTEIDSLNLEIARLAEKAGKRTSVVKTELLGRLILSRSRLENERETAI